MVDYSTPFASSGEKRAPNESEVGTGFVCGPAPRDLFNWLWYAFQSEIGEVISYAGLSPTNSDMTQLRQAIQNMIATALAGLDFGTSAPTIDTSGFLLMSQALARLPIYPVITTGGGQMTVTPGSGQVTLGAGQSFLHRGVYLITTEETDFAHSANKIYHLRWRKSTGFGLFDLSNAGYNPSSISEDDDYFDSSYDDMLIARIVTDGSNVATITTLTNLPVLTAEQYYEQDVAHSLGWTTLANSGITLNWARTPTISALRLLLIKAASGAVGGSSGSAFQVIKLAAIQPVADVTRYSTGNAKYAFDDNASDNGRIGFSWYASAR